MTYNIFSKTAPKMSKPGKGTDFIKFILSKASKKTCMNRSYPCVFRLLRHTYQNFAPPIQTTKNNELCGQMGHLIGPSGIGKAQLTHLAETIMRDFRQHDQRDLNYK